MTRYIIRRLLQAIPLLFFISLIVFFLMQNATDPLATMGGRMKTRAADRRRLQRKFGLDKPILVQYLYWLVGNDWTWVDNGVPPIRGPREVAWEWVGEGDPPNHGPGVDPLDKAHPPITPYDLLFRGEPRDIEDPHSMSSFDQMVQGPRRGVLRGDFGQSLRMAPGDPVLKVIGEHLPKTLLLMGAAEVVILAFALLIGVFSALHQYSLWDHIVTAFSFIGFSMPIFFIALLSLYIFSVNFKRWGLPHLPSPGATPRTPGEIAVFLILPVLSISIISLAGYSRYVRGTMLEVLNQDYIRTAKSKGLPRRQIIYIHALKNASLPLVTLIGLDLPLLLGGAIVTEQIFGWGGMGFLFFRAVQDGDTPVVMGILMLISTAVVIFQILTDITYAWLDPRIRYQ
jgi:peptide/nickel transport system permease protein